MKKIAFISQPEYFRFIYENYLDDIFEVREFPFNFDMTENDFGELVDFEADYNFFFRGEFFPEKVLNRMKGLKIALSSEPFPRKINGKWDFTSDSIKRYLIFRKIRKKNFDYVFHYDKASLSLFEKDGMHLSGEFTFPVATNVYCPIKTEKKWDFFFIGRSTNHREKFFTPLKHKFNFLHIAHGIWGRDLVKIINKSKICLNIHAEPEISWEPRTQMLLACGAFVISEPLSSNTYLRPDVDYVVARNPEELFQKAKYYLENDKKRREFYQNARNRVLEVLDSRKNFKKLIDGIEQGRFSKFQSISKEHLFFKLLGFLKR